jgi:hypothetical protein
MDENRNFFLWTAISLIIIVVIVFFIIPVIQNNAKYPDPAVSKKIVYGDSGGAIRGGDRRIDTNATINALKNASINTYLYQIYVKSDYADLPEFLDAADAAGIDVWAYLFYDHSEPYGLDFVTWSAHLANLSLEHKNLKAVVIDDFSTHPDLLTPAYAKEIHAQIDAVNPDLNFFPVVYYPGISEGFVENYGRSVDGIIFPYSNYPFKIISTGNESSQITDAGIQLRRTYKPEAWVVMEVPSNNSLKEGNWVSLTRLVTMNPETPRHHQLSVDVMDNYAAGRDAGSPELDYVHQILVDDEVIWEDRAGGHDGIQRLSLDLDESVQGKDAFNLSLRVIRMNSGEDVPVKIWWNNISITNTSLETTGAVNLDDWEVQQSGNDWTINQTIFSPDDLKLYVMIYPQSPSYAKLPKDEPASEYLTKALTIAYNASETGYADGIITVSLVKRNFDTITSDSGQNETNFQQYLVVQRLYQNWSEPPTGPAR